MADPLEKLDAAVRKLTAETAEMRTGQEELRSEVEELRDGQGDILAIVKGIQKTQTALTSAMTQAIKQLGTDKSLEVRVKRLEDVVFGAKH